MIIILIKLVLTLTHTEIITVENLEGDLEKDLEEDITVENLEEDLVEDMLEKDIIEASSIYKANILTHLYQFQAIKHQ